MRVICTLPNAMGVISGSLFVPVVVREGKPPILVSETIDEDAYKRFLTIPGYKKYSGEDDAVEAAIKAFKDAHVEELLKPDTKKAAEVTYLNESLAVMQKQYIAANDRVAVLEKEVADLREMVGRPSLQWSQRDLMKRAEGYGIPVSTAMSKQDILEAIEMQEANKT